MSEIAGDVFFWVYFSNFSWGRTIIAPNGKGSHHLYSSHYRFTTGKCQITKSQAFETKCYGHPAFNRNYRAYCRIILRQSMTAGSVKVLLT